MFGCCVGAGLFAQMLTSPFEKINPIPSEVFNEGFDTHASRITPRQYTPEPYTSDEFPLWVRDLARFEAVFIGAFPVAMFFSAIILDTYRLIDNSVAANSFQSGYIPELFNANHVPYSQQEQEILIGMGLAGAGIVAITDMIIHLVRRSKNSDNSE